jgi:hypothetical protein
MRSACRRDRPRCLDSRAENLTPPPEEEEPSGADFDFDFDDDDDDDDGGDDASTFPFAFFRPPRRCGGRRRRSSITDDDDAVIVDDDDDARRRRSANECCCGCGCGGGRATTTRTDDGDGIILLRDAAPAMVIAMDRCMILRVEALVGFGRFQVSRRGLSAVGSGLYLPTYFYALSLFFLFLLCFVWALVWFGACGALRLLSHAMRPSLFCAELQTKKAWKKKY